VLFGAQRGVFIRVIRVKLKFRLGLSWVKRV